MWLSRIALCNDAMRKTESVEPFYADELERRKPPDICFGDLRLPSKSKGGFRDQGHSPPPIRHYQRDLEEK